MKKIDSLVFDLGGVLVTIDDLVFVDNPKELQDFLGLGKKELSEAWNSLWPDLRIGKINENEFWKGLLKFFGFKEDKDRIKKLKEMYRENVSGLPALGILGTLKKKYNLYSLTNAGKEWFFFKKDKFNLDKYFLDIVTSFEEGIAKPDIEFFKILIKRNSIIPGKAIFIDDQENNIISAKSLGFKTILFKSKNKLITELRKFAVEI